MKRQKGLSLVGFIFLAAVVGFVMFTGFRCVPAWTEYFAIKKIMQQTADESSVDTPVAAIRAAYQKRTYIDDLPVRGTDLDVRKENGQVTLAASYARRVHIAGNTSLLFDFEAVAVGRR